FDRSNSEILPKLDEDFCFMIQHVIDSNNVLYNTKIIIRYLTTGSLVSLNERLDAPIDDLVNDLKVLENSLLPQYPIKGALNGKSYSEYTNGGIFAQENKRLNRVSLKCKKQQVVEGVFQGLEKYLESKKIQPDSKKYKDIIKRFEKDLLKILPNPEDQQLFLEAFNNFKNKPPKPKVSVASSAREWWKKLPNPLSKSKTSKTSNTTVHVAELVKEVSKKSPASKGESQEPVTAVAEQQAADQTTPTTKSLPQRARLAKERAARRLEYAKREAARRLEYLSNMPMPKVPTKRLSSWVRRTQTEQKQQQSQTLQQL
ncbi:MAG: hypothetical protein AAF195_00005, partial [Pseudomonadota bacterium]